MNKRVATIILNRNLPEITDNLCHHLSFHDSDFTDIFVVEAGSDKDKLSKNTTWYADWEQSKKNGLRYNRGMNYGLSKLYLENKFHNYDAFFLLTNDVELEKKASIKIMLEILDEHKKIGILSPCSPRWGEFNLLNEFETKYFWFIHNCAYLVRREFIEAICNFNEINEMKFFFDGENFRGYGSEHEIIAKAYANDWSAAITKRVKATENETHLLEKSALIKTDPYEKNLKLYIEEGKLWMRNKYGFNCHWSMQQYAKNFYDQFFEYNRELSIYRI